MPTTPLHILHLADLHFGPQTRFQGVSPKELAEKLAAGVLAHAKPHLVIVTGDFVHRSVPREYEQAKAFLEQLEKRLGIERKQFVLMPGNHDCNWGRCQAIETQLNDEEKFTEEAFKAAIKIEKFFYYQKFVSEFMGTSQKEICKFNDPIGSLLLEFEDLGVSIATFNSNDAESHRESDHQGALDRDQVQMVMDYWRSSTSIPLRIVALHHNPTGTMETWLPNLAQQGRVALMPHAINMAGTITA
ncbi:MAG: metallophosphoesterase [Magnetococcales bacterium]|nr:metallophosphoesterase [Magnetococcales bacterium]